MIEAWFNWSLNTASFSPNNASNTPGEGEGGGRGRGRGERERRERERGESINRETESILHLPALASKQAAYSIASSRL